MKRSSKKGFTLAELLIVIAIIAVLVAIMIPVFGAQLNKAKAASELANVRAKYAELLADAMLSGTSLTDVAADAKIDAKKLAEAKSEDETKITLTKVPKAATATEAGEKGEITVEYKGIKGTFLIDEDVQIGTFTESSGTTTFIALSLNDEIKK